MNRQILAVILGVIIVLVIGFFVWRLISSQFLGENTDDENNNPATSEQIIDAINSISISGELEAILGSVVAYDQNRVVDEIYDNTFWLAPMGGDKNLIIINSSNVSIKANDAISFSGNIKSIKDYSSIYPDWELTISDLNIIKNNPLIIEVNSLEILSL